MVITEAGGLKYLCTTIVELGKESKNGQAGLGVLKTGACGPAML
jgi:hypothetical protein